MPSHLKNASPLKVLNGGSDAMHTNGCGYGDTRSKVEKFENAAHTELKTSKVDKIENTSTVSSAAFSASTGTNRMVVFFGLSAWQLYFQSVC